MQSTLSFDGRKKKGRERLLVKNEITERGEIVAFGTRSTIEKKKSRWFIYDLPVLLLRFLTFTMMIWFPFFHGDLLTFRHSLPSTLSPSRNFRLRRVSLDTVSNSYYYQKDFSPILFSRPNTISYFNQPTATFVFFPPSKYFLYRMSFDGKKNKFFFLQPRCYQCAHVTKGEMIIFHLCLVENSSSLVQSTPGRVWGEE